MLYNLQPERGGEGEERDKNVIKTGIGKERKHEGSAQREGEGQIKEHKLEPS